MRKSVHEEVAEDDIFAQYGEYYDLLYADKDYVGEAKHVAHTLRDAGLQTGKVLELGSGTGRHGRLLAAEGFDVVGVERSIAMVRSAELSSLDGALRGTFSCIQGDLRDVQLEGCFDAVLALFHVVSYQTRNADVLATFASAARHLPAGGVFFFDVWHAPAVLTQYPAVRVKRVEDDRVRLIRIAEPLIDTELSVVTVQYTVFAQSKTDNDLRTFGEQHRMRYFSKVEIEIFAEQTGFAIEWSREFATGKTPSENTWGVSYLLRKKG